jgi:ribosome maturation factor RimP
MIVRRQVIEVSSPGLDRPLVKIDDYKKFVGKPATIKTIQPINNRKTFSGKLESVTETVITVIVDQTSKSEGEPVGIDYENIRSGHLQPVI